MRKPCIAPWAVSAGLALCSPSIGADDPNRTYESLYGAEARKVSASYTKRDDVAFAAQLLEAAHDAPDSPALQALLCEKAYEFGVRHRDGLLSAAGAMRLWGVTSNEGRAKLDDADSGILPFNHGIYGISYALALNDAVWGALNLLMRFLFVDKITELSKNKYAKGTKTISFEECFLKSPWVETGVFPRLLLLEIASQLTSWLIIYSTDFQKMPFLARLGSLSLERDVKCGDTVESMVEIKSQRWS